MAIEDQLREWLLKAERLVAGASTASERDAAAAAVERLKARLAANLPRDPPIKIKFSPTDAWSVKLFVALCRRYGLQCETWSPSDGLAAMLPSWWKRSDLRHTLNMLAPKRATIC